jgi:hypothetical protein
MKIILFENFEEEQSLDVHYEIKEILPNGDIEDFNSGYDDQFEMNPYDLVDVLEYMLKYKSKHQNLLINRVVSTKVSDEEIEKAKMKLDAKKYNL